MTSFAVISHLLFMLFFAGCIAASRKRDLASCAPAALARPAELRWTSFSPGAAYAQDSYDPFRVGPTQDHLRLQKSALKRKSSVAGDWLAPVIVWFLVILMGLAIAGFLLGER
jgi:hypothetical protein